jgi:hypothetical protein
MNAALMFSGDATMIAATSLTTTVLEANIGTLHTTDLHAFKCSTSPNLPASRSDPLESPLNDHQIQGHHQAPRLKIQNDQPTSPSLKTIMGAIGLAIALGLIQA